MYQLTPHTGRSIRPSRSRNRMLDLLHEAHKIPLVGLERRLRLAPLVAARAASRPRPGWCSIFTKAYALVAARRPDLRRAYLAFPRPRFFEHDTNVVGVTIERMEDGEPSIYFGRITAPEELPLAELDARLHHFKNAPLDQVPEFWFQEFMTKLPRCLRRLAWWAGLNVSGPMRAEMFGTFGMTTTAAAGASANFFPTPMAFTVHYGLFDDDGSVDVRLMFDHRVMDGGPASRALVELEGVLLDEILTEVRGENAVRRAA